MSPLKAIAKDVEDLEAHVEAQLEELRAYVSARTSEIASRVRAYEASLGGDAKVKYVGYNNRLTAAGVRYCERAFADGRGPSEIARALGVTVPAIVVRRQRWTAAQKKTGTPRRNQSAG
jgi:hypothetical protein